jgi:Arf-GAP/SH3 domain/ANK repeat/PH domain-containing protein
MHQLQGNKEYGSEKKGFLLKKSDGYVSSPGSPV